jgi:aspartate/methionine/tyrosine aminotransferase
LQIDGAKECAVEFFSVSKTYNMAGWRLGACVGNREVLDNLLVVKSNFDSGHFRPIYDAGTVAINTTPESWLAERNARYEARRNRILEVLPEIGLSAFKSPASLYIWAKVEDGNDHNDQQYADRALTEAGVSIAPGRIYGKGGVGYVRLSLSVHETRLEEALTRLREWHRVTA